VDPDACLARIRVLIEEVHEGDLDPALDTRGAYTELAYRVSSLDGWLARGGFPPRAWARAFAGTTLSMSESVNETTEVPVEQPAKVTSTTEVDATPETAGAPTPDPVTEQQEAQPASE
jgi:hypothetical protein